MNQQIPASAALPPTVNDSQPGARAPASPPVRPPRRSRRRKPRPPALPSAVTLTQRRLSWAQLKTLLDARLSRLDPATLKQVLIAVGVAVATATVIVALCKFVPVGLALPAVLGLGLVLQFWKEIRRVLT